MFLRFNHRAEVSLIAADIRVFASIAISGAIFLAYSTGLMSFILTPHYGYLSLSTQL